MKLFFLVFSIALLFSFQTTFTQIQKSGLLRTSKNIIYLNLSPFYPQATLEYERTLFSSAKRPFSHAVGLGIGGQQLSSSAGPLALLKWVVLTGKKNHHLELSGGALLFFDWDGFEHEITFRHGAGLQGKVYWTDYLGLLPNITLGYRYKKPGGRWMFRAGTGLPVTYAYFGCGVAF